MTQPEQSVMQCAVNFKAEPFICDSPAVRRRKELLRHGLPKSEALDSLRQKILEQRQARAWRARLRTKENERVVGLHPGDETPLEMARQPRRMTRKVCRVNLTIKGEHQRSKIDFFIDF